VFRVGPPDPAETSLLSELRGPIVGLVVSVLLFLVVGLYGIYDVVTAIPTAGSFSAFVGLVLLYVAALLLVGNVGLAFLAWGAVRVAKSVDTDSKLFQNRYARELGSPIGSDVGPSNHASQHGGQAAGQVGGGSPGQSSGRTGGQNTGQSPGQQRSPGQNPGRNTDRDGGPDSTGSPGQR
jgi:hypothetical protein